MKQNNPCYLFGMYEPDTDSVIVNAINDTYTGTPLIISSHSALNAKTISEIYFVHARFSSSADKPGNFALNSCLSNPGMQAMSVYGV